MLLKFDHIYQILTTCKREMYGKNPAYKPGNINKVNVKKYKKSQRLCSWIDIFSCTKYLEVKGGKSSSCGVSSML